MIDTASTYGDAEVVLGDVIATAGLRNKLFIAPKSRRPTMRSSNAHWRG
jgi:aryl-alcohol dehydrogenase-like predicted oxidoreductase